MAFIVGHLGGFVALQLVLGASAWASLDWRKHFVNLVAVLSYNGKAGLRGGGAKKPDLLLLLLFGAFCEQI